MKLSAGILLYRIKGGQVQVFLVHPGGPFFKKKDIGWWTIPKGEVMQAEMPYQTAIREFKEETGHEPKGNPLELKPIKQKGGKTVMGWAIEGDLDSSRLVSNTFDLEWPPKSGKRQSFPEIDKGAWFDLHDAYEKINLMQCSFLDELKEILRY